MKLEKKIYASFHEVFVTENESDRKRNWFNARNKHFPLSGEIDCGRFQRVISLFCHPSVFFCPATPRFRGHGTCSSVSDHDMDVAYWLLPGAYQTREILSAAYRAGHVRTHAYVYAIHPSRSSFLPFASFFVLPLPVFSLLSSRPHIGLAPFF